MGLRTIIEYGAMVLDCTTLDCVKFDRMHTRLNYLIL
jgi:hypothetical protein